MQLPFRYYTDFIGDKKFIAWQLMPNEELNTHWQEFIQENPHLTEPIHQAAAYLKSTGLNKPNLTEKEKHDLFFSIKETIRKNEIKIKRRKFIQYTLAACGGIALIIGLTFFLQKGNPSIKKDKEHIVGNLLNSKNIQLITGNTSLSFQQNIQVKIDEKGETKIIEQNAAEKTLIVAQGELNKLIVPYGKRTELHLADGSKVWLNSGSTLDFPANFSGNYREIHLTAGEMYIEVAPDKQKPFFVHTRDFNVQVLGTKFNVTAYSDSPKSVVLLEGSVALHTHEGKDVKLHPNEQAIYTDNKNFSLEKVEVSEFISWKNGYLTFHKAPMPAVLKKIERYYNIAFEESTHIELKNLTCDGKIYLSEDINDVMNTIATLTNTTFKRENNTIYLISKH